MGLSSHIGSVGDKNFCSQKKNIVCRQLASHPCESILIYAGNNIPAYILYFRLAKNATAPTAIVDANIKDDNGQHILIRRGTPVEISATIQKAKGVGKGAYIKLDFLSTRSVDGQLIRLQGKLIKEGQNRKGTALGVGLGVGLTVCWPCLFCLCIKGEKLTIPENTLVNNVVTNDIYQVNVN